MFDLMSCYKLFRKYLYWNSGSRISCTVVYRCNLMILFVSTWYMPKHIKPEKQQSVYLVSVHQTLLQYVFFRLKSLLSASMGALLAENEGSKNM